MPGRILLLGAGRVSGPALLYLSHHDDIQLTVVSSIPAELERAREIHPKATLVELDIVSQADRLDSLITDSDVVIGLVPYGLLPRVQGRCVELRRHMVSASYIPPEVQQLHNSAVSADVTLLNELGLDPGLDHLLAVKCFDEIKREGGKVVSYESYCGGIPAPECANNPLRYKFSWYPRGSIYSCIRTSKCLRDGKIVEYPEVEGGSPALLQSAVDLDLGMPGLLLQGYANVFDAKYMEAYGIQGVHTFVRGTLRHKGFADVMIGLIQLGLLDTRPHPLLSPSAPPLSWRDFVGQLAGAEKDCSADTLQEKVLAKVEGSNTRLQAARELGLLDSVEVVKKETPLDTLSSFLEPKLAYGPGERDMVVLHHRIGVEKADGSQETRVIALLVYGDVGGFSAMAKTVGFPVAIAAKMILEGTFQERGVVIPLSATLYTTLLGELQKEGIQATETVLKAEN